MKIYGNITPNGEQYYTQADEYFRTLRIIQQDIIKGKYDPEGKKYKGHWRVEE